MKIREVFKRGIASFMMAAVLLGDFTSVLAADDANTDAVSISEDAEVSEDAALSEDEEGLEDAAVSEDEETSGDTEVSENEAVSEDEAEAAETETEATEDSETAETESGADEAAETSEEDAEGEEASDVAGTEAKPEKLEFGKEVSVTLSNKTSTQFYEFTPQQDGFIELYVQGTNEHSLNVVIHEGYEFGKNLGIIKGVAGEKKELKGKAGLKAGTRYIVTAAMANLKAADGTVKGAFQIDFTESEYWEAELDSVDSYKTIMPGATYHGTLDHKATNYGDYYAFEVPKAGKVKIYEKGGLIGDHIYLCSDAKFETRIAKSSLNSKGGTVISKKLAAGIYYLEIGGVDECEYEFKVTVPGGSAKQYPVTGSLSMNGKAYKSLEEAVAHMTEATDYVITLNSDLIGEKPVKLPKKPTSVTINGKGHKIVIKGSNINASCPVKLENVTFEAVHAKKEGVKVKLTVNAKLGLIVDANVKFDALSTKLNIKKDLQLTGTLSANNLTTENLKLAEGSVYHIYKGDKFTVKKEFSSVQGAELYLHDGFKPLGIKGTASGKVTFASDDNLPDSTQILNCSSKKIPADTLKEVFDCADLTANHTKTYLYYLSGSKACIFGEAIEFNGNKYGLWKDAVADMNKAVKEAKKNKTEVNFEVSLKGNVNMAGKFLLPQKGYTSLTIKGNGNSLTFTSDITLTGNLTITDNTKLIKVNKKNEKVAGKIKTGKFTYTGPEITQ